MNCTHPHSKRRPFLILIVLLLTQCCMQFSYGQRRVSELTVVYTATVVSKGQEPSVAEAFQGATTTVYIKGTLSRTDMLSSLASFTTIHDAKSNTAVTMRETGNQKILIRMSAANWRERNRRYDSLRFQSDPNATAAIAGFSCIKATASWEAGKTMTIFYTPDLIPENRLYDYQFRDVPGLVLQYEVEMRNFTIRYTAQSVGFNPIPAARFEIPRSGYRELSYEESIRLRGGEQE